MLADRHLALSDGIRGLLETTFAVVVMVADEPSLFTTIDRMRVELAVVDISISHGNGSNIISRLREQFCDLKLIAISVHDEPSVRRAVLRAGADAFVLKRAIATDLIPALDAALIGSAER
ncbi:response regulator [Rhizobium sp. YTU87027]|uniref:response regulator n=1 Tax=Rhizobium sp. YTU87027 TaxID=3417741 RepID=UPI003D6832FC